MDAGADIGRPDADEYAPYYDRYVTLAPGGDVVAALTAQGEELRSVLGALPEQRGGHRYAEGKWSIRQVVGHLADAERVFAYRALSFARGQAEPLPSMDPDPWAAAAGHDAAPLAELVDELAAVRAATVALLRHLPGDAWRRTGVASGNTVSVRALAFIVAGHAAHHLGVLADRYGVARR